VTIPSFIKMKKRTKRKVVDIMSASEELVLLKDKEWSVIDEEACRVIEFEPYSRIIEEKIYGPKTEPYASVILECKKVQGRIRGYITHKIDFTHLWMIFEERGVKEDEEVIIFWTVKHYKHPWIMHPSAAFPKLIVNIHYKGYLELIAGEISKPKNRSWEDMGIPIVSLKPEVIE